MLFNFSLFFVLASNLNEKIINSRKNEILEKKISHQTNSNFLATERALEQLQHRSIPNEQQKLKKPARKKRKQSTYKKNNSSKKNNGYKKLPSNSSILSSINPMSSKERANFGYVRKKTEEENLPIRKPGKLLKKEYKNQMNRKIHEEVFFFLVSGHL